MECMYAFSMGDVFLVFSLRRNIPRILCSQAMQAKETETPADVRDLALILGNSALASSVRNWR